MSKALLEVKSLHKTFTVKSTLLGKPIVTLNAVDGVTLTINDGEILGVVGESGCGKTTLGRTILKLTEPTSGQIVFEGEDITNLTQREFRPYRQKMQFIFQDPYASLNPRMNIMQTIRAPLDAFNIGAPAERREKVFDMMQRIGLNEDQAERYPHELSGGQRQRIAIARAMIIEPKLVVCDEPVSALDVSVRAQVLNLMKDLQVQQSTTYLFISHDLSVTHHLCTRIAVMYLGKLVELADKDELYDNPAHPYTQALISAIPLPERQTKRNRVLLEGDIPSPINPPQGCRFHTRCKYASEQCSCKAPNLHEISKGHFVACHFAGKGNADA